MQIKLLKLGHSARVLDIPAGSTIGDALGESDIAHQGRACSVEVESDRDLARMMIGMMRAAMPDIQATVDDLIQEGDKIVARGTFAGTHTGGEFMGKPADGSKVAIPYIDILLWRGDKVAEHWGHADMSGLMG